MMTRVVLVTIALTLGWVAPAAQRLFAQKYIAVAGYEGRPVSGLAAEDFSLRDGDVRRPMQGVEPATTPLVLGVAVDGFGESEMTLVDAWIDRMRAALKKNASQDVLMAVQASKGPSVIETLLDTCAALNGAATDRRAIVAIIRQGANAPAIAEPYRLTDALRSVRASLWAIVLVDDRKNLSTSLDNALAAGAQVSGGLREVVTSTTAVAETETRFLQLLSSQYLVTFLWPDPMLSQLNIVTRHESGVVLAPAWNR